MYDVIVVGARVAGSPTAMLLARAGYRVLLVDRATFPSDTLSTHQLQIPGSLALKRWGLLDTVLATDPGAARRARFDMGEIVVEGAFPLVDGVGAVPSPRRHLLDKILVDAAVAAGAEAREDLIVEELLWDDGRVVGIQGRTKQGGAVSEHARVVVGADGKRSLVAKAVGAPVYDDVPALTCGYYSYWEHVPVSGGELYLRGRRVIGAWPTNQQLTMIYLAWPATEFDVFRADVEANYMATIELAPGLAERVRQGRRAERIMGSGDMPNFFRKPFGPGWALVGDAGYTKDPVSAMGISDAFRDAELLAAALDAFLAGRQSFDVALRAYERQRNVAAKPFYDFTLDTARMRPFAVEQMVLMRALQHNPAAASQFLGVLTGVVNPTNFFAPQRIFQILGVRGMAKMIGSKVLHVGR